MLFWPKAKAAAGKPKGLVYNPLLGAWSDADFESFGWFVGSAGSEYQENEASTPAWVL